MIERSVCSGYSLFAKQFSRFSLGISKSHSRMYLKWTRQNLTSFANSLSLSLSLSLSGKLFLLLSFTLLQIWHVSFRGRSCLHWLYWKNDIATGGNRTRFDPHLSWNTCICYGHSLLPLLQDWQFQVSGGMGFSVLVNRLLYKHAPLFTGAIHHNPISHGPY